MSIPTVSATTSCLNDLLLSLKQQKNLYIHCWGGRGRAGTIGGLLLGCLYPELSTSDVLKTVQLRYETRDPFYSSPKLRSPETDQQEEYIKGFLSELRR